MADGILTEEAILAATEDVLRKYGPAKATVVDVARVLGVSHGSIYRHFPSKSALREAVTARWLDQAHSGLAEIASSNTPAAERLAAWLRALHEAKRHKALDDPELFRTYSALVEEQNGQVIQAHLAELIGQLSRIVADGQDAAEFSGGDAASRGRAIFNATVVFHAPVHAWQWNDPEVSAQLDAVIEVLLRGLTPR